MKKAIEVEIMGERVTLRYAIVCRPRDDGLPCDGSGVVHARAGAAARTDAPEPGVVPASARRCWPFRAVKSGRGGGIRTPKSGFGDRQFNR